jgi:hypothetical protein
MQMVLCDEVKESARGNIGQVKRAQTSCQQTAQLLGETSQALADLGKDAPIPEDLADRLKAAGIDDEPLQWKSAIGTLQAKLHAQNIDMQEKTAQLQEAMGQFQGLLQNCEKAIR